MKKIIEAVLKVLAIFVFINAIPDLIGINPRVIFIEEKDAEIYQWIFSVTIAPFIASGCLWLLSSYFSEKIIGDESGESLTINSDLVTPLTFSLGLYLVATTTPSLVGMSYNVFTGEFPSMDSLFRRASIVLSLKFVTGVLFIFRPKVMLSFYNNVAR